MKLNVIDLPYQIGQLMETLSEAEFVAYDTETTGLTKSAEVIGVSICASENEATYIIIAKWNAAENRLEYIPDMKMTISVLLELLQTKNLIMHNSVFDCMMAESFFKVSLIDAVHTDTMLLAHLLDENRKIGLKDLAKQMYGENAAKEQEEMKASVVANGGSTSKSNYEMFKCDPYILGKYGAKDALLTYKLFMDLVPQLYEQGLDKFFYEEESMPLLKGPTYQMNNTGLKVDGQGLLKLKKQLQAEIEEAKAFVYSEINQYVFEKYPGKKKKKDTFNIGSSSQLSWLMFEVLELEFGTLTTEGKKVCKAMGLKLPYTFPAKREFIATCLQQVGREYEPEATVNGKKRRAKKIKEPWGYIQCGKEMFEKHAPRYKWIATLAAYQKKTKLLSTYVEGIEERVQYGIIHPSFKQAGTTSGRYSSSNPNFQNLPRDDKRIKECIISRPGKVFVGADQSQLEPRVFSYYSRDERLMAAFDGETDFYSTIGIEVYGKYDAKPLKEGHPDAFGVKYKKERNMIKNMALARAYGGTAPRLAKLLGKTIEATQDDMDRYDERFPGVKAMMVEAHELAMKQGYVTSLFGRPRRIPEAMDIAKIYGKKEHDELPYDIRSILNLACNHRIQSTGASIVNRGAIRFSQLCTNAGIIAPIVLQVHDQLVAECSEQDAEAVALLLQEAMENTVQLEGIRFEAIPKIAKNLAEL